MVTLPGYPNLDQKLTGRNGWRNCVPTSIDDGLEYLTGQSIGVETLLAEAYGPNYAGFCAASAFVDACAKRGVKLWHIDGSGAYLVQAVHAQIRQGHPTIATEPDPYAADHPDWSHVISFFEEDTGTLTAKDPYSVANVTHTDSIWANMFEFHQVWAMERIDDMAITINSPGVSNYFSEQPDGSWLCKQTGKVLAHGMLSFYERTNGLLVYGLPITSELPVETINPPAFEKYAGHGITLQFFERGILVYDEGHLLDFPPGAGSVYPAHLYTPGAVGTDPRLYTLQKQLQAAQTGAGASTADPRITDYQGRLKQINALSAV